VELHVHGETKRKAKLPPCPSKGKDVKKVRAALLGAGSASGAGSVSGVKGPESGLIELPKISMRKDIAINLPDTIINSIDGMEANHIVRTMVEFRSKALILSRRVGSLYRWEVKEGGRERVEELLGKVVKLEEEKAAWKKEREGWEEERKRLATWRVRCLDSKGKLNKRIGELEEDYDELKDKYDGAVSELDDLKNCIIQEHINGFEKGLRQAAFFHQEVDIADSKFDVNKDVIDGKLVKEDGSSLDEEAKEKAAEEEKEAGDVEEVAPDAVEWTSIFIGTLRYIGTLLHLCLMRLMFCMLLCMMDFDDLWCMYGAFDCMLRVFDPGRLLVVRVGNLNELNTS